MPDVPPKIRFEYIKSQLFRVIHVDGAFGGMTPRGQLFISLFSERYPIPTAMIHAVTPSGRLGEELRSEREERKGIVREVEVGLQFELEVAKSFVTWLQTKIEEAEKKKAGAQGKAVEQEQIQ